MVKMTPMQAKAKAKAKTRPSGKMAATAKAAKATKTAKAAKTKAGAKPVAKAAASKANAAAARKGAAKKPAKKPAPKAAAKKVAKPVRPAAKAPATAGQVSRKVSKVDRVKNGAPAGEATEHGEPLTASETAALLDHVRDIVRRLPSTTEVEAWGHPTFRVNDKIFVGYGVENGTATLGVKTTPDMQAALVSSDPRFSVAAYVGKSGWVSMSLAGAVDLAEVEALVRGSYRLVAPTKLVRQLDEAEG
jgi:predicted DNA-binding protein (MmcQ/YjbR family)